MVSSLIFLAGIAFAYATTGTLSLAEMAVRLDDVPTAPATLFADLLAFGIKAAVFPVDVAASFVSDRPPGDRVFAGCSPRSACTRSCAPIRCCSRAARWTTCCSSRRWRRADLASWARSRGPTSNVCCRSPWSHIRFLWCSGRALSSNRHVGDNHLLRGAPFWCRRRCSWSDSSGGRPGLRVAAQARRSHRQPGAWPCCS